MDIHIRSFADRRLGHPIFNFRGEYDKLDEYDEGPGGKVSDTRIMSMAVRMRRIGEARWTAGGRLMGDGTGDGWRGRGE